MGEQGLGELANHGTHKIRGKVAQTFQDFPGSAVQLGNSVFHAFPDGLLDQEVQNVDALVGLGLLDRFLGQGLGIGAVVVHFGDQLDLIGGNGGQADYGSVERVYKVDGHADAHAHRGIDGAGNGIYRGIRIIVGGHLQGAVQLNGNAVVDDGFIQVFLDVEVKACRNLNIALLVGLGHAAVSGHGLHLVAAESAVAGVGQVGSTADCLVCLGIRRAGGRGRRRART